MKNPIRNKIAAMALAATMAVSMVPAMSVSASAFDTVDTQTSVTEEVSQQYVMQPGDVFVTNNATFGHASIAISPDKILHIGGFGEHPSVMSLAEWNARYSSKSGTWTKVYRINDPVKAVMAAKWAEKTYCNSDAIYMLSDNVASTDWTYCSKLVWQAFYYGAYEHPGEAKHDGFIWPYSLKDEIPNLHLVHTFEA